MRPWESIGIAADICVSLRVVQWKGHLAELEKEMAIPEERLPKYVVFQVHLPWVPAAKCPLLLITTSVCVWSWQREY